ncbi:MAG: ribulokinase, partial [candidate division Zixibacteria bacterium]|nr:ribulokinase [candidate division KSB1 bacterium]NIR67783.1 ribulokinase [candidate division Zixibacteria bacterium]NIS49015.1 ribulokinase [candidate division Zixibacteria bacterium]NIT74876.1 ribulokinase [candidate division KSB1 bacterium]NIU17101.1 ribulokinase [candidate division Zixibacteria bacterium]
MPPTYTIGLDFGTNSVRALVLDLMSGEENASETASYPSGENGVLLDERNPHLARQYPGDYLISMTEAVQKAMASAKKRGITAEQLSGIGV